jgi:hypothetical protein
LKNIAILGKSKNWIKDIKLNPWNYGIPSTPDALPTDYSNNFIDYILEDKSKYPFAKDVLNPKLGINYIDPDNDFLVGKSGGLLMNMNFMFVNTSVFTQVSDYYTKNDKYCPYEDGTTGYNEFWQRETRRRRKGIQARCKVYHTDVEEYFNPNTSEVKRNQLRHYIRITGDHYNYINYGRIERTPSPQERIELDLKGQIATNTVPGFPRFWDADYWYFKMDEFIIRNKKNSCLAKARRKGISYKRGNQSANRVNLNPAVTVVLAADILSYLTDAEATADMAKKNLDWYESNTYWKRGFLSESLDNLELGYKRKREGNKKYGFRSKILSVAIGRNESAAIGKKAIDIDFEEAGKSPNLKNAWGVTLSNIESGAIKIGTGRIYGTAGTKNANWTAFSSIFYNTEGNNMVSFENVWNYNARHKTCGFFIPQIWCCEPYIYDGNSLLFDAWLWDKKDKIDQKANLAPKDYVIYCAQRANSPSEAFIDTKDNLFTSPILNDHIQSLMDDPVYKFYTDGWYVPDGTGVKFLDKTSCITRKLFGQDKWHPYIEDVPHNANTDIHGIVREHYTPYHIDGVIPKDLYFITVDTYRIDKDKDQVDIKNSLYSIQCWMRTNSHTPYMGRRLVAEYCGRLDTMAQNDQIALHMALRYNCGVLPEAGTGEIISNFKVWGYQDKLMIDPTSFTDRSIKNKMSVGYGVVVGDAETKIEGLRELRDFIYTVVGKTEYNTPIYRINQVNSLAFCLELQRYNLEGNFDRVSSAIVAMFEFKKDFILGKEEVESKDNNTKSLRERLKRR